MSAVRSLRANLHDAMLVVPIDDFSGGLNSEADSSDLTPNESPDCQNVKFTQPGRVIGRDGWVQRLGSLPANRDGIAFFYDNDGTRRLALWANGNLYDVTSFALTVIASAVYTAGKRIAWTTLNNVLYYSDGTSNHMRRWNPATSTEEAVPNAGGGGNITPPGAAVLTTVAGSIVAGNTNASAAAEPHAIRWSAVNDPTTWAGTSIFQVGQGQGGVVNSLVPFSVSSSGISPYRGLFVGKSRFGCWALDTSGGLASIKEVMVNAPVGVLDGATAKFAPGPDGRGFVLWLATDHQVWMTNGSESMPLSSKIRTELSVYIVDRLIASSTQAFTAVVNYADFQYILDVGNTRQYAYDYAKNTWTRYVGWPSGYWADAKDSNGMHVLFVADTSNTRLVQANTGADDGGTAIAPYWKSGYLHDGHPGEFKIWKWVYVAFSTDRGDIDVEAKTKQGTSSAATATLTVTASTTDAARWDVAKWNEAVWAASIAGTYTLYKKKARLKLSTSGLDGSVESLRGYDVQLKLSTTVSGGHFEVLGARLLYLPRNRKRVA